MLTPMQFRQIVAYANNTQTAWPHYGWFGISLCEPFFTMNTLAEVYSYYANHPNEEMQMIYMEASLQ